MSYELNEKIKNLTPYDPIEGNYRVRLDANEAFSAPNAEMMEKIHEAIDDVAFNRYPDPSASKLCELFARYYGINKENVTAGNGSDELISIIAGSFLQKGDKAVTLAPDFSMYGFYLGIYECENIVVQKKDYKIDADEVIKTVNDNSASMLIFSNPCNPTSILLDEADVRKIIENVDALVVLDEAYMDFATGSLIQSVNEYDNLIVLRTCSKAVGMASIRLGFAVANERITRALKSVKSPYNVNSVSQAIGERIFSDSVYVDSCISRICTSRDLLLEELKKVEKRHPDKFTIIASQANFVYNKSNQSKEIFEFLKTKGIIVRCFGDHLRISAGRNHENIEVAALIDEFLGGVE
ncbi:MAG: histidinol-phosphate transaminase [Oscillospiraceae bacterium]|nr:histidinol-phosphate transaminase [Oscillospiraceae bacterium]